jgi:hypothetical protein
MSMILSSAEIYRARQEQNMVWKIILGIVVFGVIAFAAMNLIPATREGGASIEMQALPEQIVAVLRDVQDQKSWRSDIKEIKLSGDDWIEVTSRDEEITFRWTLLTPERAELAFSSRAGYAGKWIATLSPIANGTRMEVVERTTIPNPISRLIARIIFDPAVFSQSYLSQLKARVES